MLNFLFIHQARGCIAQCEESVVFITHSITVAGERVDEQLQLIVSSLGDMDAHTSETVLQMVGAFLKVCIRWYAYNEVVVSIDQLLVLFGHHFLHTFDVFHSHLIAGVGHTGMTVFLLVKQCQLTFLVGHIDDLVVHHDFCSRNVVHQWHEVNRHTGVVHLNIGERTDGRRQIGAVHIDKAIDFAALIAHINRFFIYLEIAHRHNLVFEVHGKKTINIFACLLLIQEVSCNAGIFELVLHLTYLYQEVTPFLIVKW